MGNYAASMLFPLFLFLSTLSTLSVLEDRKTYIIHMDKSAKPDTFSSHHGWYTSTLSSLSSLDSDEAPTHLYTYRHVMDGFSAVLSQTQLDQLENLPGHLATFPESFGNLHTTRSPTFLGLKKHTGIWPAAGFGSDIIIGVFDTGIWPESESFNDEGMPPVPERWRGTCEVGTEFNSSHCNKKLIGARKFSKGVEKYGLKISETDDYDSPRDFFGHGSHTSSTAAGSRAPGADSFGYAKGTAIGVAPMARIAMYKVVFYNDSYEAAATDVLAGMDQAIEDGVDVMSLSLAFPKTPFDEDPIAIGAFAALKKGIFVACSAGNGGPRLYTVRNGAPWITSVGAGKIDRDYAAKITIGDEGQDGELTVSGNSEYPENLFVSGEPIYFGRGNLSKEICQNNSLDSEHVAGKYIFCDFDTKGYVNFSPQLAEMSRTGAAGGILSSDLGQFFQLLDFSMPYALVKPKDGDLIKKFIMSAKNATVSIKFQITVLGTKPAPQVARFSSRGPDSSSPWILKPDILAPGLAILAAWAPNRPWQPIGDNYLLTDYAIASGTSMSCPHIAGVAALVKAIHRDWSSAAIRSAMMTTANVFDNANGMITDMTTGVAATPLDFGAGHVNPNNVMDPGLIYDVEVEDYISYLCGLNYTGQQISVLTGTSNFTCKHANLDLNYPSFVVILNNNTNTTCVSFKRVLTNVADTSSVYTAVVEVPTGMKAVVQPKSISFSGKYSKAEFDLTVEVYLEPHMKTDAVVSIFGFLTWYEVNGKHTVRSPVISAFAP